MPLDIGTRRPPFAIPQRRLGDELARLRFVGDLAEVGDLLGQNALVRARAAKAYMRVRQSFLNLGCDAYASRSAPPARPREPGWLALTASEA